MKIAFSTLGCPDFTWDEILSTAKDLGFEGIEVRGMEENFNAFLSNPFDDKKIDKTVAKLKKLKIEIPCLSSNRAIKFPDKIDENAEYIKEYIDFAAKIGTPYIRILGDAKADVDGEVDDAVVIETLKKVTGYATERGVTLLVETNGVYGDTKRLCEMLSEVRSESVGALWDIHHPYRYFGEEPQTTIQNLGAFIKYVHIKDSIIDDGKTVYKMIGEGDLPIDFAMQSLRSINYDGFITLEWLKAYAPDLAEAGVVFPHFANFMSEYTGNGYGKTTLIDNNRGTGKYIWPKETLIDLTFPEVLDAMVRHFPDQTAFKYTHRDYERTYAQFSEDVDKFAKGLISLGVKPGDHVAIWATNVPEWFITFWATVKIGAVLVTVNTAYKIHEAEYLLRQSDTHTLVMNDGLKDSNYIDIINTICPELSENKDGEPLYSKKLPFLRNVVTIDSKIKGSLTFDEAIENGKNVPIEEITRRAASLRPDDVCNMQYTSGTTGFPKGVMLTHYNIINNGKAIADCMDLSTADKLMIQVPMFHCFGMVLAMTASMTHGTSMYPIDVFSPTKGLECINKEKITAFHGVPTMFIAMLSHPDFDKTDFSHMRTGIMAGSPCPIKVMEEVFERMHMDEICITYGQTEASPGCTMSKTTDSIEVRVGTVGSNIFGVECKIVDPETNEELPINTDGEFVARGYNIMKGYYKMPQATADAIDADGWLHTGDLARVDENGNYKITGRIKDMIIRGGENIYPKEIEEFIYTHPKVSDVQVVGVPDKAYGEEIMAAVILKEGETLTEQELKDYCLANMAKHKNPRYVSFVDSFPMNAAGKIQKYKMREQAVIDLKLGEANSIETA